MLDACVRVRVVCVLIATVEIVTSVFVLLAFGASLSLSTIGSHAALSVAVYISTEIMHSCCLKEKSERIYMLFLAFIVLVANPKRFHIIVYVL